jgi:hypothetical protein
MGQPCRRPLLSVRGSRLFLRGRAALLPLLCRLSGRNMAQPQDPAAYLQVEPDRLFFTL